MMAGTLAVGLGITSMYNYNILPTSMKTAFLDGKNDGEQCRPKSNKYRATVLKKEYNKGYKKGLSSCPAQKRRSISWYDKIKRNDKASAKKKNYGG